MLKIARTTEPTEEPLTIEEAKLHLRVDGTDEDAHIMNLIIAAREYAEEVTWRSFCTQIWRMYLDCWPRSFYVALPRAPLRSVTHLKYTDENGSETTLASSNYIVSGNGTQRGSIAFKSSFSVPSVTLQEIDAIEIEFVAGYGDPSDVPQRIKQALLLIIGHWYENREEVVVTPGIVSSEVPMAAQALFHSLRAW
ncbi:MAG: head-tail connector protein [Chloroflexota bacterium]